MLKVRYKEVTMRNNAEIQRKIDAFLDRKTHKYPELEVYAHDTNQLATIYR